MMHNVFLSHDLNFIDKGENKVKLLGSGKETAKQVIDQCETRLLISLLFLQETI